MLRAAEVPNDCIHALKAHRCDVCITTKAYSRTNQVSRQKRYVFNHKIIIDQGRRRKLLRHPQCCGLRNDVRAGVHRKRRREGEKYGVPSSSNCSNAFVKGCLRPLGWPSFAAADRGSHNIGVFALTLPKKGVRINPAALESPQIGRVERRNLTLKQLLNKVIKGTNLTWRSLGALLP